MKSILRTICLSTFFMTLISFEISGNAIACDKHDVKDAIRNALSGTTQLGLLRTGYSVDSFILDKKTVIVVGVFVSADKKDSARFSSALVAKTLEYELEIAECSSVRIETYVKPMGKGNKIERVNPSDFVKD